MNITTRFAPSPTGLFHAGSYRTALFAYIFAKQNKGKFILRIEDTDKERSKKEYEDNIIDSLKWLNIKYDEFYRQSERAEIYKKYLNKLVDSGIAYISKETPKEKQDRSEVIRFKNPNKKVTFNDLVRGHVTFDTTELGDFVIAKSLDEPIFHLVNVIDDLLMGVSHIIRGEDHISNTPRQILIFEAIGAKPPEYIHLPLLLGTDRSKLSKRQGALAMTEYREKGYIPDALINYMALLGWHPADDRELLSLEEIIRIFSIERIQKGGAIFNEEKLNWFNHEYIAKLSDHEFVDYSRPFVPEWLLIDKDRLEKLVPILREKIMVFADIKTLLDKNGELSFVKELPDYKPDMLLWKKNPSREMAKKHLSKMIEILTTINNTDTTGKFDANTIKDIIWSYAETNGKGDVLWPLRFALTGQEKSPDPFTCASILGKDKSIARIEIAIKKLTQ
jgi:glutamyl-tRNA synthetase